MRYKNVINYKLFYYRFENIAFYIYNTEGIRLYRVLYIIINISK